MFLSDSDIKDAIAARRIIVRPEPDYERALGPCSLDLRLGPAFRETWKSEPFIVGGPFYTLAAGQHALGATLETLTLADDIACWITGRSSYGRQWITVTGDSGLVTAGWRGQITLELRNHGAQDVALPVGGRICQVVFVPLSSPSSAPYGSKSGHKYFDQHGPTASRIGGELA